MNITEQKMFLLLEKKISTLEKEFDQQKKLIRDLENRIKALNESLERDRNQRFAGYTGYD